MRRERMLGMLGKLGIQGGGRARCVVSGSRGGRVCRLGVVEETGRRSVRVSEGKKVRISTMSGQVHQKNAMNYGKTLYLLCNAARASGTD